LGQRGIKLSNWGDAGKKISTPDKKGESGNKFSEIVRHKT